MLRLNRLCARMACIYICAWEQCFLFYLRAWSQSMIHAGMLCFFAFRSGIILQHSVNTVVHEGMSGLHLTIPSFFLSSRRG